MKRLLRTKSLLLLALCAPFGLVVFQECRRLVEDHLIGVDLSKIPPPQLATELQAVKAAPRFSAAPASLALLVCLPDRVEEPGKAAPPLDAALRAALTPRARGLEQVKRFARAYEKLHRLKTPAALAAWKALPAADGDPFPHTLTELRNVIALEMELRPLAEGQKHVVFPDAKGRREAEQHLALWQEKLDRYREALYHSQDFAAWQAVQLNDGRLTLGHNFPDLDARLGAVVKNKDSADATELEGKLRQAVDAVKEHLRALPKVGSYAKEAAELRQSWEGRRDQWLDALKLLDLRAEAFRVLDAPEVPAVKDVLVRLGKLADFKASAAFARLVKQLAHTFCDTYLPPKLPLHEDVIVFLFNTEEEKTVKRADVKIVCKGEIDRIVRLDTAKNCQQYNEFKLKDWTYFAKKVTVNEDYYLPKLKATECGQARHEYAVARAKVSWNRKALEKLRGAFTEAHLGPTCWERLTTLAKSLPASLER